MPLYTALLLVASTFRLALNLACGQAMEPDKSLFLSATAQSSACDAFVSAWRFESAQSLWTIVWFYVRNRWTFEVFHASDFEKSMTQNGTGEMLAYQLKIASRTCRCFESCISDPLRPSTVQTHGPHPSRNLKSSLLAHPASKLRKPKSGDWMRGRACSVEHSTRGSDGETSLIRTRSKYCLNLLVQKELALPGS